MWFRYQRATTRVEVRMTKEKQQHAQRHRQPRLIDREGPNGVPGSSAKHAEERRIPEHLRIHEMTNRCMERSNARPGEGPKAASEKLKAEYLDHP